MSDIFREVDEEVRQQQIIDFVKRYGKYVVAAVVAAIIVFVVVRYLDSQQAKEHEAAGERFEAARTLLVSDQLSEAAADFAVVAEETGGADSYGLLARFGQGEALYEAGDMEAAVTLYDSIAADGSVGRTYRDLAALFAATASLGVASNEDVLARLAPLQDDDVVWRLSAMETAALLHYQNNERDEARALYEQIELAAPEGSAFAPRARQMLAILGPVDAGTTGENMDEETVTP